MAVNMHTVKDQFDTAISAIDKIEINGTDESTTDTLVNGKVLTHMRNIVASDTQTAGYFTYNITYIVQLYQAKETIDGTVAGTETKTKENAVADNFDEIVKAVYSAEGSSDADLVLLTDGEIFFLVEDDYQCFAGLSFEIQFRTLIA